MNITVQIQQPRLLNVEQAETYVGGRTILERMLSAGWLKHSIQEKKLTRYDVKALDAAVDRLRLEDLP